MMMMIIVSPVCLFSKGNCSIAAISMMQNYF
jgi:hypothetical protein